MTYKELAIENIKSKLEIGEESAKEIVKYIIGYYICNFDDQYICREYNGGCDSYGKCKAVKRT